MLAFLLALLAQSPSVRAADFGAKADARCVMVSLRAGSDEARSDDFSEADLGKLVMVRGAGRDAVPERAGQAGDLYRQDFFARIAKAGPGIAVLDRPALRDALAPALVGTDNAPPLQAAADSLAVLDPAKESPTALPGPDDAEAPCTNKGGDVLVPEGLLLLDGGVACPTSVIGPNDNRAMAYVESQPGPHLVPKAYHGIRFVGAGIGRTILVQANPGARPRVDGFAKGVFAFGHQAGQYATRRSNVPSKGGFSTGRPLHDVGLKGMTIRQARFADEVLHGVELGNVSLARFEQVRVEDCPCEGFYGGTAGALRLRDGTEVQHRVEAVECEADGCGLGGAKRGRWGCTAGFNMFSSLCVYQRCRATRCGQSFETGGLFHEIRDCAFDVTGTPDWALPGGHGPRAHGGESNGLGLYRTVFERNVVRGGKCSFGNQTGLYSDAQVRRNWFDGVDLYLYGGMRANVVKQAWAPRMFTEKGPDGQAYADLRRAFPTDVPCVFEGNLVDAGPSGQGLAINRYVAGLPGLDGQAEPEQQSRLPWRIVGNRVRGRSSAPNVAVLVAACKAPVDLSDNDFEGFPKDARFPLVRAYFGVSEDRANLRLGANRWGLGSRDLHGAVRAPAFAPFAFKLGDGPFAWP